MSSDSKYDTCLFHTSNFLLYSTINSPMHVIFFYPMSSVQYFDTFFGFIQSSLYSIQLIHQFTGHFWYLFITKHWVFLSLQTVIILEMKLYISALNVWCVCVCVHLLYCTSPEIWQWLHMLFPGCLYFQVLWRSPYICWKTDTSNKNLKEQIITEWTSRVCERSEQTCLAVFWSPVLWYARPSL